MRIVFMGTPDFAKNIMSGLLESGECEIAAAYTREDAVRGRGEKLIASPVKQFAIENGIPFETPKNFNDEETLATLAQYEADFIVVAAYGLILPKAVLDAPKYECLNVHGSLLPKWRGAAPVQRAILAGDAESGFTIMRIGEGLDDGDMYLRHAFDIEGMTTVEVLDEIARTSVPSLIETMRKIVTGEVEAEPQDELQVSFADKIEKRELWFSSTDNAEMAYRKVLASDSASPAKCKIANRVVTVVDAKLVNGDLVITKLKPDGKNEMDWKSFVAGVQDKSEENLR